MDKRYFNILGRATRRLLLKRPGYDIDIERIIEQAGGTDASSRSIPAPTGWTYRRKMRGARRQRE